MENCICTNKTLLTKEQDLELYWGFSRWRGRAKTAFVIGILIDSMFFFWLCIFTGFLLFDHAGREIGYLLLCIISWLLTILFILLTVFQGHIYANKCEKARRRSSGP